MKITEIIVSAGRTFNHPFEQFSNLRPQVTMKATLDEHEDPDAVTKSMQAKAEKLVEDHKTHILDSLHKIEQMAQYERTQANLEQQIKTAQEDLEIVRSRGRKLIEEGGATEEIPLFGQRRKR